MTERQQEVEFEDRFNIKSQEDWAELMDKLKSGGPLYFKFRLDDEGNLIKEKYFKTLVGKATALAAEQMIDLNLGIHHDKLLPKYISLKMQKDFEFK